MAQLCLLSCEMCDMWNVYTCLEKEELGDSKCDIIAEWPRLFSEKLWLMKITIRNITSQSITTQKHTKGFPLLSLAVV